MPHDYMSDGPWRVATGGAFHQLPKIVPRAPRRIDEFILARLAERPTDEWSVRDVAVKRRILDGHSPTDGVGWLTENGEYGDVREACGVCGTADEYAVRWPCRTVQALACLDSDHPDFNPEWSSRFDASAFSWLRSQ